ncbi:MAG: hypothetical protein COW00_10615 [Bdellovibrio sp. CG12_big_fil_rev_8_21_14_0_65_39_13]|nr:MAG: hypothetical protein COW78_13760 [Bdellovibrio sp. CG22_combo_CG10-13_8_21_14_all_39_27]PIQ59400.1 MAG: hypothetical protein COW00_10615 [Bdellovibrio sp. CG12_big_fil_rev_8_21_14_0_65_39_13]PIR34944.1 MAG: hypothetical protein COV37_11830 [Bdellovibrio sp. CG11_big_fil_rev_8_21_14_0_20_39_38]PJB52738.1 MAG: hypothetical protein CO099_11060 [Bdellovibrio sp. CG_4_9_14_3_um_filter_39_7]
MATNLSTKVLFYQGRYKEVLKEAKDIDVLPHLIGAHSFLGQMEEATGYFQTRSQSLQQSQLIEARFYLALGFVRISEYKKARVLLGANLKLKRKESSPLSLFFIYQGLAFYRYFCGRWDIGLESAELAFQSALESEFDYGKVLSSDLRGHLLVQVQNVDDGLRNLKQAHELAVLIKNKAIADATEISLLTYEAEFGFHSQQMIHKLENKLKDLEESDTYTRSTLLLELARQQMLRGQVSIVKKYLDEASYLIYMYRQRRQEAILNMRWSYLHYISGDYYQALSFVQSAMKSLDLQVDHILELAILGLELKIVTRLNIASRQSELVHELAQKNTHFGGNIHKRILHRFDKKRFPENPSLMGDRLAQLIDQKNSDELIRKNYLLFLYDLHKVKPKQKTIYLDLIPHHHFLFDRGQISACKSLTPLLRKIIEQLALQKGSKEELISLVWGYQYDPLRHDSLIYTTIVNLRKWLGPFSHWVETTESGYSFQNDIHFKSGLKKLKNALPVEIAPQTNLNFRQVLFLKQLKKGHFVNVHEYEKFFHVSEITACRDLAMLHREGYLLKMGRARATRYTLPEG